MAMKLKKGVSLKGIQPEMVAGFFVIDGVFRTHGRDWTITSGTDGKHGENSLHKKGLAVDIRTNDMPDDLPPAMVRELKEALGEEFDVVLELPPEPHIHVEFDPD